MSAPRRSTGWLDRIERLGNALPDPATLFVLGALAVMAASQLAVHLDWSVEKTVARGGELGLAAPDVLASGLATALFTTLAGLVVFLFGQAFLIAFDDWREFCERGVAAELERAA